jgi:polysaccharide pyruvyl transferase WcaK-like protein
MKLALKLAARTAQSVLRAARDQVDADRMLQRSMSAVIDIAEQRHEVSPAPNWRPGEPLKMLLAGYAGTRNTGADVRVEEMIRQFRHLFSDDHLNLSIFTLDLALTRGYFKAVQQVEMPKIFPQFLYKTIHEQHGVIACEGSMFKSKFANALSTMMVGAIGLALVEGKVAVGYGGEAGKMDPSLEALVRKHCQGALIIARNEESCQIMERLGVAAKSGTDTAWTFDPADPRVGADILRRAGWDGKQKVLAIAPINPFWWPVKPDMVKGVLHKLTGMYETSHYDSIYFHNWGPEVERKQKAYIEDIAKAVRRFRMEHDVFITLIGMEQLDRRACEQLDAELGGGYPIFVSDRHDMYTMISILRQSSMLVASRYHACVCSMAGGVVSGGVTMDERIANLMAERGQPYLRLNTTDDHLDDRLYTMLLRMHADADEIRDGIYKSVTRNLYRMGEMGRTLVDHVQKKHPEFPFKPTFGGTNDPWTHLPPLPPLVEGIISRYASQVEVG